VRDRDDVVSGAPERPDDGEVTTLVSKKPHRSGLSAFRAGRPKDDFFVGESIGGKLDRSLDILSGKSGVGVEQVLEGDAFGQLPQHQFNRDPRASYDRLAEHDVRPHFDALMNGHQLASSPYRATQNT
jgi:hypothetical protein